MSPGPRTFLVAGVTAVLASFALVRQPPLAPTGGALPPTAPPPAHTRLPAEQPRLVAPSSAPEAALLRAGRFDELLRLAVASPDEPAARDALETCVRLAPPRLLAEHALGLPAGPLREDLLLRSFARWAVDDPAALGEWALGRDTDAAVLDHALARVVEHSDSLHRPVSAAIEIARLIRDPDLRLRALRAALREWAADDAGSALRFAESAPGLTTPERFELLDLLAPPLPEI